MTDTTCANCGKIMPPHDVVSVALPDDTPRLLCSRCFNTEMAQQAGVRFFEHPEFAPVCLLDTDGVSHVFHFRSLLFGDQFSLEAFEMACNEEDPAGYRFQLLGEPQTEPFALLAGLVRKIKRALSVKHLVGHSGHLQLAGTAVRGRLEWDGKEQGRFPCVVIDGKRVDWGEFGSLMMTFEGWQFRMELVDPSDEA